MSWTAAVCRRVLPSGLTLLVERHAVSPVVAVVIHVKAGYFDEPDEWSGIAHVLEHMYFKGTATRPPGSLAREVQLLGGYTNAGTIYDKTVYYAVAPSAGGTLGRLLDLQLDALRHLTLDPAELARELEVIVQEARRKLDTPGAVTVETLYAQLYRRHRMGRWRIGTPEGLRRLTAADLTSYYRSRYAPGRVILSLVGDLDPDRAVAMAEEALAEWTAPTPPIEDSPEEPPGTPGQLRVLHGDVARPIAAFGWRTVGPDHPDTPALDLAADVLSAGRTGWLDRGVRDAGLAAAIGADHYTPAHVGVFDVSLTADAASVASALARATGLVRVLADVGPTGDDLARVRALLATRWARRLEAVEGRATAFAEFEALGGVERLDDYLDRVLGTDGVTIRRAVATWLSDAPAGALYLPHGAGVNVEPAGWPPVPDRAPPPPARMAAVAARNGTGTTPTRPRPSAVTWRASPAADLLARPRRGGGLVTLGLFAPGLRDDETPATAGRTRLLVRAALRTDDGALAGAAERLGGALGAASGAEVAGWTLTVPSEHAGAATALLAQLVESVAFAPEDVAIEARLQADLAAAAHDDMYRYPLQRVLGAAFGDDPVALPSLGHAEHVRATTPDDLGDWLARWRRRRPLLAAVGDLAGDRLLDLLESATRDWEPATTLPRAAAPRWRAALEREGRDKQQSALAMAFPAPALPDDARHARDVVGAVLSGLAGRLFEELREKRSLAYTVQCMPWQRARAGAMLTYIATAPERMNEAREGMLAELARLAAEPVPAEELARARNYAAGLRVLALERTAAVLDALVDGWCTDTLADLDDAPSRLRAVTAEDVQGAAAAFTADRAEFVLAGTRLPDTPAG